MATITNSLSAASNSVSLPKAKAFHIPSLDGIRGIAFLLVFVSHAGLRYLVPGGFGVTIFFVLSGYLITTLLRLEYAETGKIDLKAFYLRRAFRILPLFYLILGAALLLRYFGQTTGQLQRLAILSQVFNWSNYYMITYGPDGVAGGTIVFWSLAIEEHFYLVFPLVFWLISRYLSKRATILLFWVACLGCLIWRYVLILHLHCENNRTDSGTDTRFDCLLLGAMMAIIANPVLDSSNWFSRKRLKIFVPLAVVCLLFTFLDRSDVFRYTLRYSLQAVALLPLFAYAILARNSPVFKFLNSGLMTQLGVLSYALYLMHALVLDWFTIHLHGGKTVVGAVSLATALVAAQFLNVSVERPFQSLRKRYSRMKLQRDSSQSPDRQLISSGGAEA